MLPGLGVTPPNRRESVTKNVSAEQALKAIDVVMDLGFKAHAPVDPRRFADPAMRETWRQDFGMVVMSFWDPENRRPTIDLFAEYPMDKDEAPPIESFGRWTDAETLRRWSFLRRTPQQRLDWLVAALTVAYEAAAYAKDRSKTFSMPAASGDGANRDGL